MNRPIFKKINSSKNLADKAKSDFLVIDAVDWFALASFSNHHDTKRDFAVLRKSVNVFICV